MKLPLRQIRKAAVSLLLSLLGLVLLVLVSVSLILSTQGGSRWALARIVEQLNGLPGHQFSLGQATGTLTGQLHLQDVQYSNDGLRVSVAEVDIGWNPLMLLSRQVSIPELLVSGTVIERTPGEAPPATPRVVGQPLLDFSPLPLTFEFGKVAFNNLTYRQPGQQLQLDALQSDVRLVGQELTISGFALESELADIGGNLTLTLTGHLPMNVNLDWQYNQDIYPGSGPMSGDLSLGGDLTRLAVAHNLTRPFSLTSVGVVDTGVSGSELQINLSHSGDSVVLPSELTGIRVALNNLALETSGSLRELQISLATEIESDLAPASRFSIDGRWLGDSLEIGSYELATPSGLLTGSASLSLNSGMQGSLHYRLSENSPLAYVENFMTTGAGEVLPFELFNLHSNGDLSFSNVAGDTSVTLQIAELSGELGDYPFQGGGRIDYGAGRLHVDNFNLATSDNRLFVTGSLAEQLDFNWQVQAPRLDQLMPGLEGRLSASGEISGEPADVELVSTLTLNTVRYRGSSIDSLQLDLSRQEGALEGRLTASGASLATGARVDTIDGLQFQVSGTETSHRAILLARSSYGDVDLDLTGGFTDLSALAWDGELSNGTLTTPVGNWSTNSAVAISVTSDAIGVTGNCWWQNAASICIDLAMQDRATAPVTRLTGRINNYPLELFNHPDALPEAMNFRLQAIPHLPESVSLGGTADAEFSAVLEAASGPVIEARLLPRDLTLTIRSADGEELQPPEIVESESQIWLLKESSVEARLENESWEAQVGGNLERQIDSRGLTASSGGSFSSRVALAPNGALEGTLNANLDDLGWLEAFVPEASEVQGSLATSLVLGGSLENPSLAMELQLTEGQVSLRPLGIVLTAINANLNSRDNELIELGASLSSNGGNLALSGRIIEPFSASRRLEAQLSGDRFSLANLPDLNLAVSPDLGISAGNTRIDVTGDLFVPTLNITVRELPEQAVDVSRDAVVVGYPSDRPQLAAAHASEQSTVFSIPVVADVNILLGENISLNGFGFTSTVAGNLNVLQQVNGTNLTYGELQIVRGDYRMYGQSLQIRGGKLLFFGPIDNPALDIRATRTVEGTTVGVLMNGTLKNIRSQLFSTPALPDGDIIAILATGKPFSEIGQGEQDRDAVLGSIARLGLSRSQGLTNQVREQLGLDSLAITNSGNINNTTLTVGKYLTPDIFIRYGFGLFDHQSKLALDYILTDHITLQAETGEYQSVDLIYRVER